MRRNNPIIKKPNDKVGDILLYNKKICKIIIANGKLYNNNIFPLDKYIPIGIIVVPSSHTYNNMARAVSLAEMDCSNPNKGNTQCHKYINWGGYGYIIDKLGFMNHFPYFKHYTILSNSINIGNWCAMSSDYFNGDFNLFMTKEKYYFKDKNNYAPSPYSEDESKNPLYGDTSDITNVFSDMNGKGNTSKILAVDNSNSTDWQTASTINNESRNEHVHPAAQCCWRYLSGRTWLRCCKT